MSDIASHCYHRPPTEATKSALAAVARLAGLVAGLLVAAPVQSVLAGGSAVALEIDAKPVVFAPWQHERQTVGALEWRGGVELDGTSGDFGGYSGFVLSRDGRRLFAVSDRGTWLLADIAYEDGRLAGLSDGRIGVLTDPAGRPFSVKSMQDAEAVAAFDPDDPLARVLVGFERQPRVLDYRLGPEGPVGKPTTVRLPDAVHAGEHNRELEGIARFGPEAGPLAGAILVSSEANTDAHDNIRAWIIGGAREGELTFRRSDGYDITDIEAMDNGDVLVLERRLSALLIPSMRIRLIGRGAIAPGAIADGTILLEASGLTMTVDNMEAIAVSRAAEDGELRITVMSDDNFNPLQRTLLLQFALPGR